MLPWLIALGPDQLEGDVDEQDAADGLQLGNAEKNRRQCGKENAQADRAGAAEDDRFAPILGGETTRRHPDDDGVVA